MDRWGYSDGELRVRDSKKNELRIQTDDWEPIEKEVDIDRPTEDTIAGTAKEIRVPICPIAVKNSENQ